MYALKFKLHDAEFCFNDGVSEKRDALDILGVRPDPNAMKQLDTRRMWKSETAKLNIFSSQEYQAGAQKNECT